MVYCVCITLVWCMFCGVCLSRCWVQVFCTTSTSYWSTVRLSRPMTSFDFMFSSHATRLISSWKSSFFLHRRWPSVFTFWTLWMWTKMRTRHRRPKMYWLHLLGVKLSNIVARCEFIVCHSCEWHCRRQCNLRVKLVGFCVSLDTKYLHTSPLTCSGPTKQWLHSSSCQQLIMRQMHLTLLVFWWPFILCDSGTGMEQSSC